MCLLALGARYNMRDRQSGLTPYEYLREFLGHGGGNLRYARACMFDRLQELPAHDGPETSPLDAVREHLRGSYPDPLSHLFTPRIWSSLPPRRKLEIIAALSHEAGMLFRNVSQSALLECTLRNYVQNLLTHPSEQTPQRQNMDWLLRQLPEQPASDLYNHEDAVFDLIARSNAHMLEWLINERTCHILPPQRQTDIITQLQQQNLLPQNRAG